MLTPLATSVSLARFFYVRALLLVDWHGSLHAVVASSLSTVPGAKVFQTTGTLAHPLSALPIRPWCRGERRLIRSSPCYTTYYSSRDRFSRCADIYAVSVAEFVDEGTADILVNKYVPLWGCPATASSPIMDYNSSPRCRMPCASSSTCE